MIDVRLAEERDGIHAAVEIFRTLGIRCIFATAFYDQDSLEHAKPAMQLGWLQKPYSMVSLVNAVRRAFKGARRLVFDLLRHAPHRGFCGVRSELRARPHHFDLRSRCFPPAWGRSRDRVRRNPPLIHNTA